MKKVFLLESDELMLKSWEVALKDSSWELYALDAWDDFDFRVEDFGPDLIVIGEDLLEKREVVTQIPIVSLGGGSEHAQAQMAKPLDIAKLSLLLDEVFAQVSKQ